MFTHSKCCMGIATEFPMKSTIHLCNNKNIKVYLKTEKKKNPTIVTHDLRYLLKRSQHNSGSINGLRKV